MKVSVVGGGNAGQAIAGVLGANGHEVCLYNRHIRKIVEIANSKTITLEGKITATGQIKLVTDDLQTCLSFSKVILVVTTADAHAELAEKFVPFIRDGQIIVLIPGRTGGLAEFRTVLSKHVIPKVYIAETSTLPYACRIINAGKVDIIGVKDKVLLSVENKICAEYIMSILPKLFSCFIMCKNWLYTSMENIGTIFHPPVVIFNAAAIERGEKFYFYRDMTEQVSDFILCLDRERLVIGEALGLELLPVTDWVSYSYEGVVGSTLLEKMRNNAAYHNILAPQTVNCRQLLEDIPTGLVPMSQIATLLNLETPLMDSIIEIASVLLNKDFRKTGRTLDKLGISGGLRCLE